MSQARFSNYAPFTDLKFLLIALIGLFHTSLSLAFTYSSQSEFEQCKQLLLQRCIGPRVPCEFDFQGKTCFKFVCDPIKVKNDPGEGILDCGGMYGYFGGDPGCIGKDHLIPQSDLEDWKNTPRSAVNGRSLVQCGERDEARAVIKTLGSNPGALNGSAGASSNTSPGSPNAQSPRQVSIKKESVFGCPDVVVTSKVPGRTPYNMKYQWTIVEVEYSWNAPRPGEQNQGTRTEAFAVLIGDLQSNHALVPVGAASHADLFDCKKDKWTANVIQWRDSDKPASHY